MTETVAASLLASALAIGPANASPPIAFHRVHYSTNNYNGAGYDPILGIYSMVGFNGELSLSYNGQQWSTSTLLPDLTIYGVAHSGELVGVSGNTSSPDQSVVALFDLVEPISPPLALFVGSEFVMAKIATNGTGIWVVVGGRFTLADGWSAMIWRSIDHGQSWSATQFLGQTGFLDVIYGGGQFVLTGQNGLVGSSTTGSTWSFNTTSPAVTLNGIAYGGGRYVAVGPSGRVFVALGSPTIWSSASIGSNALFDVHYGDNCFVAVGQNGFAARSTNGSSWTSFSSGTTEALESVTYGAQGWLAVGNAGTVLLSNPIDSIRPTLTSAQPMNETSIEVTFSENMDQTGTLAPGSYTISGPGKGSVAANPTSVQLASRDGAPTNYLLTWSAGAMIPGEEVTIQVANNLKDNFNNLIASPFSVSTLAVPVELSSFILE